MTGREREDGFLPVVVVVVVVVFVSCWVVTFGKILFESILRILAAQFGLLRLQVRQKNRRLAKFTWHSLWHSIFLWSSFSLSSFIPNFAFSRPPFGVCYLLSFSQSSFDVSWFSSYSTQSRSSLKFCKETLIF